MLMNNMVIMILAMHESTEGKPQCTCKRHEYNQFTEIPENYISSSHKEGFSNK